MVTKLPCLRACTEKAEVLFRRPLGEQRQEREGEAFSPRGRVVPRDRCQVMRGPSQGRLFPVVTQPSRKPLLGPPSRRSWGEGSAGDSQGRLSFVLPSGLESQPLLRLGSEASVDRRDVERGDQGADIPTVAANKPPTSAGVGCPAGFPVFLARSSLFLSDTTNASASACRKCTPQATSPAWALVPL